MIFNMLDKQQAPHKEGKDEDKKWTREQEWYSKDMPSVITMESIPYD